LVSRRSALAGLALLAPLAARAEDWPSRPIRMYVPFPPGGGTDIISRVIAQKIGETLGQPVVIENKPGAGGGIGVDLAAKSAPDGYTIVMGQTSNLAINPALYPNLPYDPLKDLVPVALVADAPLVLVVPAGSKFDTIAGIVAAAKDKPGDLTFATAGNGTVAHLVGEQMQLSIGIKIQHIPYKGASPALTDLMGGRVDMYMSSVPSSIGQIKAGKIRPVAVTSAKRSPSLPDVPTISESGHPGFDATTWFGILAPAGTPQAVVDRLNKAINAGLKEEVVREKIAFEGGVPLGGTAAEFAALLKVDIPRWGAIVRASGAKID
jgi:tripartite-type tricarboxylate transporter receptor subunit TctC